MTSVRLPIPPREGVSKSMQVRLTPAEHQSVVEAANRLGVSFNWIIRQSVLCRQVMDQDEAAATPHGGTERAPVVVTEREVARPQPERFEPRDLGPGLAQPKPAQPQPAAATVSEPPAPLPPATGLTLLERLQAAAKFTPEQVAALAPCEARQLFNNEGYEKLSEEVEIELASGVVVKGQAAGQFDGWVQVTPCRGGDGWPVEAKGVVNIAAPITAVSWPSQMGVVQEGVQREPQADAVG